MTALVLHGRPVDTVFQLLGERENDMTYSLGWALSRSPRLLEHLLRLVDVSQPHECSILMQSRDSLGGITDVEIVSEPDLHVIIEAKRGWSLPSRTQLDLYARRLVASPARRRLIVALSECTQPYADAYLEAPDIPGIETRAISWREITRICESASRVGTHAEKRLLAELSRFLRRTTTVQPIDSNMVYVVALGGGGPAGWPISWIDIVVQHRRYFHPIGGRAGWPKEPPNYIAFRYGGRLRSIHHVESYEATRTVHEQFADQAVPHEVWEPHFVYRLGPHFGPSHDVPTGRIYPNGRVWCMLDTLFTAASIGEARDLTKARLRGLTADP